MYIAVFYIRVVDLCRKIVSFRITILRNELIGIRCIYAVYNQMGDFHYVEAFLFLASFRFIK